jgi:hypothetical protein
MNLLETLPLLRKGLRASREAWASSLHPGDAKGRAYLYYVGLHAATSEDPEPYFYRVWSDGSITNHWMPRMRDLLAEDWIVVDVSLPSAREGHYECPRCKAQTFDFLTTSPECSAYMVPVLQDPLPKDLWLQCVGCQNFGAESAFPAVAKAT